MNDLSEYCISLESEKNELFTKVNAIQKTLKENQQKIQTLEEVSTNQKSNGFSEKLCYDYNKFENKFRGSFSDIEERQKHYSQYFFGCKNKYLSYECLACDVQRILFIICNGTLI